MKNIDSDSKRISEENEMIHAALVTDSKPNQLPERLFVNNFLPFFCGELDIDKEPNFFAMWFGIAGSPSLEVSIIDDLGKVLYRVPSIMDSSIINPNRENSTINFAHIVTMAKLYGNITPIAGENALNGGLAKKYSELQNKSKVFSSNEQRWMQIFARYGKIKVAPNITAAIVAKKDGSLSDDDFEF